MEFGRWDGKCSNFRKNLVVNWATQLGRRGIGRSWSGHRPDFKDQDEYQIYFCILLWISLFNIRKIHIYKVYQTLVLRAVLGSIEPLLIAQHLRQTQFNRLPGEDGGDA